MGLSGYRKRLLAALVLSLLLHGAPLCWATTDTYTTAGTFTWTCPTGVTSVQAEVWAGGGGGGAGNGVDTGGGGGGGGAYSKKNTIAVTPSTGYTVIVGAAGLAGTTSGG